MMKSYTIHLIRHGITEGNLLGQYIGVTDSPLSQEGRERLLQQREAGGYPQAQAYYTSPLSRCRDTLHLLYPDAKPQVVEDFRECDFGEWEGKTADELKDDPAFARWMEQGETPTPPGGESSRQFIHRTCQAFETLVQELLKSGTTSAVVVAHGGTLMAANVPTGGADVMFTLSLVRRPAAVRTAQQRFDYLSGYRHALVELSDSLSASLYDPATVS